ncbi:MAG: DUF4956 domain-containing protein [Ruminococcus sp.]|nr:DUF4956 domain-containing protein [Ruminococcus sp.]
MFNNITSMAANAANTLFTDTTTAAAEPVGAIDMIATLGLGVLMGVLISILYIYTHRKSSYSSSYVLTILILPVIVSVVLVMINSMASALSLAGVFTLCRYRTVPGDPKDITYVFFAMATGVICGINRSEYIWFLFVFFIVIAAVLVAVEMTNFGKCKTSSMTLKITIPENMNYVGLFDGILDEYTTSWKLRRIKTTNFGSLFELIYSLEVKNNADQKQFLDELRNLNGNLTVVLTLFRYDDKVYEQQ